jgi:hypothetical protein
VLAKKHGNHIRNHKRLPGTSRRDYQFAAPPQQRDSRRRLPRVEPGPGVRRAASVFIFIHEFSEYFVCNALQFF